jgi:hypothetical protein
MLDDLYTIKGMNGETKQGTLTWINYEEFWFNDGLKIFWGKIDYWYIIAKGVKIFKISVTD